jgi:hypothetical protein
MLRVRDRKTGNIRTVTQKAYAAMGPKVYEKLGTVDETATITPQVSAPGAKITTEQEQVPAPEQEAEVTAEAKPETEVKPERKKPGRKPKNQISSDSTEDEK